MKTLPSGFVIKSFPYFSFSNSKPIQNYNISFNNFSIQNLNVKNLIVLIKIFWECKYVSPGKGQ